MDIPTTPQPDANPNAGTAPRPGVDPTAATGAGAGTDLPGGSDPVPEGASDGFLAWVERHAKPRFRWERHTIPLMLFDPIPPAVPRPRLLLANLLGDEVLPLERVEVPGRKCPDFIVRTVGGRDLGRLTPGVAARVAAAHAAGYELEVCVFATVPSVPPESELHLELHLVVWCAPADWVERPRRFSTRRPEP